MRSKHAAERETAFKQRRRKRDEAKKKHGEHVWKAETLPEKILAEAAERGRIGRA